MKIIILGAGKRGSVLAQRLVQEHRDVVLVDSDHKRVSEAASRLDCMVVQGSGLDREILKQADIEHASHFVAVTDSDEVNLVACGLVESLKSSVSTIAAIRNLTYTGKDGLQESVLGINHIVNPEAEAARSISLLIDRGMFSDTICFDTCGLVLHNITIEPESRFSDKDVQTLRKSLKVNFIIAAILRENGEAIVPSGGTMLHGGDTVSLVASESEMDKIYKILGKERFKPKKIAIVGGSKIARFLLRTQSPSRRKHMILVDQEQQVCETFATVFPEILVIQSDITDESIFQDEHLDSSDLLMSLTDNDELNIITASYAKRVGVDRTISLIKNNNNYIRLAKGLGIDSVISVSEATVDSLMKYLRGEHVSSVHSLFDGKLEVVEFNIEPSMEVCGKRLKDISMKGKGIIAGITTAKSQPVIPTGEYRLETGDMLLVCTERNSLSAMETLFT